MAGMTVNEGSHGLKRRKYPNDERDHWFFCDRHKTKWRAGSNLFSSWREEDDEVWQLNRFRLAEYMTVSPIHVGLS